MAPTYAQLEAESWWNREIVTEAMDWLGDELCRRTGRPRVAAGTKGDRFHLRGAHRSQEWLLNSRYSTSRMYTVQPGLSGDQLRWVAGFDFTPGSDTQMIAQCKRLYQAMRSGLLDEVLEFYGNLGGDKVVDGWDNLRDRAASADDSHLWHWHISVDRRHCGSRALMERILTVALGDKPATPAPAPAPTPAPVEDTMTPKQFLALLRDPAVAAELRRLPWQYIGGGIPAGKSTLRVLAELHTQVTGEQPDPVDERQVAAEVLAVLTPAAIAAALPDEVARQVADELARRMQS